MQSTYNNRAIFFDRDGVINKLINRKSGFFSPRKFDDFNFYDDIKECIDFLSNNNFLILIISNQPDISRGEMEIEELNKMDKKMNEFLHIDDIYYSFDSDIVKGGTKKPSPKMLLEAKEKWKIDLSKSFFIGDSVADRDCAKNANVSFILVSRSHNKELNYVHKINSLNQIKDIIEDKI